MGERSVKLSGAVEVSSRERRANLRSRRRPLWIAIAGVLAAGGLVGSVFAAASVARADAGDSRAQFAQSSAEVASTLRLAIEHEADLVVNASAFVAANPDASQTEFVAWTGSVHLFDRYPEVSGVAFIVIAPAAGLQTNVDPPAPRAADESPVFPLGERPFSCLFTLGLNRSGEAPPALSDTAAFDPCLAPDTGPGFLSSRDSGETAYTPIKLPDDVQLSIAVPLYRGGAVPETVDARRDAFLGWLGAGSTPTVILDRALQAHPDMAISMRYRAGESNVAFSSGDVGQGYRVSADLGSGWTVETFGELRSGGVFGNTYALVLLVAGVALSLLLAVLVLVLGTGRARALRLVGERTGELRHQALHDALTGLPNRALIMDRIEQLLVRNRRQGSTGAALFIDLDDFKNVNDTLGHQAGDRLLMTVAARLTTTLRDADTVGRMGGDEFVVLIDGAEAAVTPELVAQRLLDVMRQPFVLEGATMPLIVNTSIGIAVGDRPTGGDLLRDADVALYQAKGAGKNCYAIFDPEMQTEVSHRIALEFDLRCALEASQFHLVYQPIYNLDDLTLIGVEALLRWDHPTLGVIEPEKFIPILEQTGQIREVGAWVLRRACQQMANWHDRGDHLDISVNVSGRQLDNDDIVEQIRDALHASGLAATSLIIEITETALMHNATDTASRLHAIKALGVRIAVDDFGTGYSSLAYLGQFPVDCLKIDRSFTSAITTSPESKALIGTLVQLGRDLGLKTLAEGVETAGELDHLRGERVNEAQGFLLSRPLDAASLETQLLEPLRDTTQTPT